MSDGAMNIEQVSGRTVVSLKASPGSADEVRQRLSLSAPLRVDGDDDTSMWVSPGCWLLMSDGKDASALIDRCATELNDTMHLAVDYSDAMAIIEVSGAMAREVLASACALDFRESAFPTGTACRTRFAQIAAFVVATGDETFELYVDASYRSYMVEWLEDSASIAASVGDNVVRRAILTL